MIRDKKGRFVGTDGSDGASSPRKAGKSTKAGLRAPWTKDKEEIFFRELTMVCNVSSALRKAGLMSHSARVYDRRRQDARFRAQWDEAIAESYALLELEMLERARFGDSRPKPRTEVEKKLRAIPDSLGLQLLKLYQARVKGGAAPGSARREPPLTRARGMALRRELEAMLSDFNRRMGGNG
jgi:hypothetical protein